MVCEQAQNQGETAKAHPPINWTPNFPSFTTLVLFKEDKTKQLTQLSKSKIKRYPQEIRVVTLRGQQAIVEECIFDKVRTILSSEVDVDNDIVIINYFLENLTNVIA